MNYKDKEVTVIDEEGNEHKIKQFCQCVNEEYALISSTSYDNENNIYHKYFDCYEDWPQDSLLEFKNWKVKKIINLNEDEFRLCARCHEREYRKKHPDIKITGYDFHYYYEKL